jgi:hypothetical protein
LFPGERKTIEPKMVILYDNRSGATVTGTKRGAMIGLAVMVRVLHRLRNPGAVHGSILRHVNTRYCREHHQVKGQYEGETSHAG